MSRGISRGISCLQSFVPAPTRCPPPQPVNDGPPLAPVLQSLGGSMFGGIGSTITEDVVCGTGSGIAFWDVDGAMGGSESDACGMPS